MSDEAVQQAILVAFTARTGVALAPARLELPGGAGVDVAGVSADRGVLVEVYGHRGKMKGGQPTKIARDALKLVTIAHGRTPRPRLVVAFADDEAAAYVQGRSWLAEALQTWRVEVFVAGLEA